MKNKLQIFKGFLLILFSIGFLIAQTPDGGGVRFPAHDRLSSKQNTKPSVTVVAVKFEGNRLLGVRSLGEKKLLQKDEIEAKAVTDGESIVLAFENKFKDLNKVEIAVEKEILIDEETSKALGSNVFSILDGKYPIQSRESPNPSDPTRQHRRVWTIMRPTPEHNIFKTFGLPGGGEFLEVEVSNLRNEKELPKSVLVTIKDGILLNIKAATGNEKIESKDVFPAKAMFVNTQLVLQFSRPLSREAKTVLKTNGDVIGDKETSEALGVCSCSSGSFLSLNPNSESPTVKIPVIVARYHRHRWLFRKTSYGDPTDCEFPINRKK